MAKDKNARYEQENWTDLRPGCHPDSQWKVSHSMGAGIYNIVCAQCGKTQFRIMIETKQW